MRKAVQFLPVMMLAGCASISADNCAVADWSAAGYSDGARGEPFSAFAQRPDNCAQYAAADIDAYLDGVLKGVANYCDPANAFATGVIGDPYFGVCTGSEGDVFEVAYGMGRKVAALRQASHGARQTLADIRAELWEVKQREAFLQTELATSTVRADRREYRDELEALKADRTRLEAEITAGSRGFAEAQGALIDFRSQAAPEIPEGGVLRPIQASY